jgi:hypothetical protein
MEKCITHRGRRGDWVVGQGPWRFQSGEQLSLIPFAGYSHWNSATTGR